MDREELYTTLTSLKLGVDALSKDKCKEIVEKVAKLYNLTIFIDNKHHVFSFAVNGSPVSTDHELSNDVEKCYNGVVLWILEIMNVEDVSLFHDGVFAGINTLEGMLITLDAYGEVETEGRWVREARYSTVNEFVEDSGWHYIESFYVGKELKQFMQYHIRIDSLQMCSQDTLKLSTTKETEPMGDDERIDLKPLFISQLNPCSS